MYHQRAKCQERYSSALVVVSSANYRAFQQVRDLAEDLKESFRKGHVSSAASIPSINSFEVEIASKYIKYAFQVERIASDVYRHKIGNNEVDAEVSLAGDGALLATFGGETHLIFGRDETLGLRFVLDGNTHLM